MKISSISKLNTIFNKLGVTINKIEDGIDGLQRLSDKEIELITAYFDWNSSANYKIYVLFLLNAFIRWSKYNEKHSDDEGFVNNKENIVNIISSVENCELKSRIMESFLYTTDTSEEYFTKINSEEFKRRIENLSKCKSRDGVILIKFLQDNGYEISDIDTLLESIKKAKDSIVESINLGREKIKIIDSEYSPFVERALNIMCYSNTGYIAKCSVNIVRENFLKISKSSQLSDKMKEMYRDTLLDMLSYFVCSTKDSYIDHSLADKLSKAINKLIVILIKHYQEDKITSKKDLEKYIKLMSILSSIESTDAFALEYIVEELLQSVSDTQGSIDYVIDVIETYSKFDYNDISLINYMINENSDNILDRYNRKICEALILAIKYMSKSKGLAHNSQKIIYRIVTAYGLTIPNDELERIFDNITIPPDCNFGLIRDIFAELRLWFPDSAIRNTIYTPEQVNQSIKHLTNIISNIIKINFNYKANLVNKIFDYLGYINRESIPNLLRRVDCLVEFIVNAKNKQEANRAKYMLNNIDEFTNDGFVKFVELISQKNTRVNYDEYIDCFANPDKTIFNISLDTGEKENKNVYGISLIRTLDPITLVDDSPQRLQQILNLFNPEEEAKQTKLVYTL